MLPECEYKVTTKFGELLIIDEGKRIEDSVEFCESKSAKLPPLNKQEIIDEISSHLQPCTETGFNGNIFVRSRNTTRWRIGLITENREGKWSDGQEYSYSKHFNLFQSGYAPNFPYNSCKSGFLYPASN